VLKSSWTFRDDYEETGEHNLDTTFLESRACYILVGCEPVVCDDGCLSQTI